MTLFDSFLTLFGLFGPLGPEGPGDSFLTRFLTLLGFRARRARNGSVAGGGFLKTWSAMMRKIEGDGDDRAGVIGLIWQVWGSRQISLIVTGSVQISQRVSNAALANAALVLSSKNWKNIQDGGQRRQTNPKSLELSVAVRE